MDGRPPHASARCLCDRFKPAAHRAAPGAKRPLDSAEQVQALQSAKKACVLSHQCSTPDRSGKLLLCSHGSPCFQGASRFLDDAGGEDLVASSVASEYNDAAVSLGTTRCSDDSEPDDSLLELSDSEEENSPFSYTEEEIQEILADDCVESELYLARKSTLSQSVNGESAKDESSSCAGASDSLSRACSSLGSECCPGLPKLSDTAVGKTGQEETTSGKKPGKVIPVPQEDEERLKQQTGVLEAELEQKKHLCAECARLYEEDSSCYPRNYPRPNKKPTRRYSLTQWVSKDLAKHRYFRSVPDHFQRSPVTTFSNV